MYVVIHKDSLSHAGDKDFFFWAGGKPAISNRKKISVFSDGYVHISYICSLEFMVSLYVSGSICMNPRGYQKKVIQQSSLSLPKADKIPEIIDRMVSNSTSTTTSRRKIQDQNFGIDHPYEIIVS